MKRGLDWYKREQRAVLDGIRAARMTDRQAAIYNILLDLIYDGGGETPDDPKHVSSYLSNVGTAAARATIQQLVDIGKVYRVDGMLHQKRAENEAKTRRKLSETRTEIGRLGGISSGVSRRESSENNGMHEANASSKREAEREREKEREKEVVVVAPASAAEPLSESLYCRVLSALRLNHADILPARWMPPAAIMELDRLRDGLGLTDDDVVAVADASYARHGSAPDGPRGLRRDLEHLGRVKAAPPPSLPAQPAQGQTSPYRQPGLTAEETRAAIMRGMKKGTADA